MEPVDEAVLPPPPGPSVAVTRWLPAPRRLGRRDGLMAGLHRRTGRSLRVVRVGLELTATTCGFLLGGVVGIGTLAFALLIGPGVQFCVHRIGGRDTHSL